MPTTNTQAVRLLPECRDVGTYACPAKRCCAAIGRASIRRSSLDPDVRGRVGGLDSVIRTTAQFFDPAASRRASLLQPGTPPDAGACARSRASGGSQRACGIADDDERMGGRRIGRCAEAMRLAPSLDVVSKRYAFLRYVRRQVRSGSRATSSSKPARPTTKRMSPHRFLSIRSRADWATGTRANAVYESALRLILRTTTEPCGPCSSSSECTG